MKNATERPRNMIEIMETDRCCETMVKFERHGSKGALKAGFVQPPTPNSHQKAYNSQSMVWFASTDNHQGLFDWFLCFPPETVRWFGELRDYELQTIAEFVASFFADRFQIIYELSSDSENFYIHFVGNTVRLDTSHEDMKGFVHIWLNHLHSLFGFLVCEYGMVFEMADIFRRYPMCYQKIDLREKWN